MMIRTPKSAPLFDHPIALMRRLVEVNDWRTHHQSRDAIAVELSGYWSDYYVSVKWQEEYAAIHISALLDIFVLEQQRGEMLELISRLNERIWLGHFNLTQDKNCLIFQHTTPLRGTSGAVLEQMLDLVEVTFVECEKYYPALFQLSTGAADATSASQSALMETQGCA